MNVLNKFGIAVFALLVFSMSAIPFVNATDSTSHADFNGDGLVNALDKERITANWGSTQNSCYDLNGDGVINVPDLLMLLGDWHDTRW